MTKVRAILRRRWPLLAITTVLGILAGTASALLGSGGAVEQFEAEQVLVATADAGADARSNVTQDQLKVTRGEVPGVAAELLGEPDQAEQLARDIDVTAEAESNSITLVATADDPERASNLVQAFSQAFLEVVNAELRSEDTRQLDELRQRADDAAVALEEFDTANADVLRPDAPVQDTPALNALLAERQRLVESLTQAEDRYLDFEIELGERAPYTTLGAENPQSAAGGVLSVPSSVPFRAVLLGLVGLVFGIGLVLVLERLSRRIDTRDELAELISVPILAEIHRLPPAKQPVDAAGRVQLEGAWSEDYRRVRSAIQFVQAQARADASSNGAAVESGVTAAHAGAVISGHASGHVPRVFLFASALPSEGKSTSTALTALALAETGENALVINADFRRPTIEKYLGVSTAPSLADLARMDPNRPTIDKVVQPGPAENLWVAAAGPPTLDVKNRLRAAADLASEAARQGGTVLIDSSPLRITADPMDLMPVVDEVVLVVRSGATTVKSLEETIEMLDMHHAPVLGVVLICTPASRDAGGYYGTYFDDSHKSAGRGRGERTPAPRATAAQPAAPQPQPAAPQPQPAAPQPQAAAPQAQPQPAASSNGWAPAPAPSHPGPPPPGAHARPGPPPPGAHARPAPPPPGAHARPAEHVAGVVDDPWAQPAPPAPPAPPPYDPATGGPSGSPQSPFRTQ